MATLREIRRRVTSVKSTQKITKAMKMVAAAKLRRAQEALISTRPYARKMNELLRHLVTKVDLSIHPLLQEREVKRVVLVVVSGDRGNVRSIQRKYCQSRNRLFEYPLFKFIERARRCPHCYGWEKGDRLLLEEKL